MSELQLIYDQLDGACCPEDIFGSGDDPSVVFKKLARVCHPDKNPADYRKAVDTFAKLSGLKDEADNRVRKGVWGKKIPLPHCIPLEIGKYKAKPHPRIGDTENESLKESLPETHNGDTGFQGSFRVGHFDWELARKALGIVGRVDGIALSHMDCLPALGWREKDFLDLLSESTDIPVVMKGYGPTAAHRKIEMEVMA